MMRWSGGWPGCGRRVCCRRCRVLAAAWLLDGHHRAAVGAAAGLADPSTLAASARGAGRLAPAGPHRPVSCWRRWCAARGRSGWSSGPTGTGWALPSEQLAALAAVLVGILYALVPEGRWRQTGKWVATALVALVALAHLYLGVEAPTDVLVSVAIGVAVPLLGFRWFAPSAVFPVSYRRGRTAHLDVGGARGQAIRQALQDQLGVVVEDVEPFGLAGSAGLHTATHQGQRRPRHLAVRQAVCPEPSARRPLVQAGPGAALWAAGGREAVPHRAPAGPAGGLRAVARCTGPGCPLPRPYGVVELTPEREYLLVTEFFDSAVELGEAEVDDQVIDDGLGIIRRLWEAGLAHRDIKPANLLVRDGHLLLIDVFFAEVRPSPWRQAVDLANMMLCLALRSSPERVYQRARAPVRGRGDQRGRSPPLGGWPCPPSCGGCCASRAETCTPSSSACCPPGPTRSGSNAGAPAGSGCCC